MKKSLLALTLICCLCSCTNDLGYKDYFNYFNTFSEGSYIQQEHQGFVYKLQLRPTEYLAVNSLKTDKEIDSEKILTAKSLYDSDLQFCLRISSNDDKDVMKANTADASEYYSRIELLNKEFSYYIKGISDSDTSRCQFHHFERNYQVQPFIQVLFSLNTSIDNVPSKIEFTDRIFNNGTTIAFENFKHYTKKLPKLKL